MKYIIYEDNHILVVEKQAGILSQADGSPRPDIINLAKNYLIEKYQKQGQAFVGLVHRLDYQVAGVLVLAKTSKAAARLSEEFRKRTVKKTYLALVEGVFKKQKGEISSPLKRVGSKTILAHSGKVSVLNWQLIKSGFLNKEKVSLLEIDLITGFKHQIRAQLAFNLKTPIVNDVKYNSTILNNKEQNIALWASNLKFKHPVRDEIMEFESSPLGKNIWPWQNWNY